MTHPFRSSYFALLDSYVPQLFNEQLRALDRSKPRAIQAGAVGIFGALGQNDGWADTDYADIRANVKRQLADPSVKAITLIVDSPGGSVLGLPETADVIHAANKVKPVKAVVSGIAASAAYWLASQASTITMTPSGEMGSIGVLDLHANISKALENAGIELTAVTAGPHKTERAPFTALSDDAKAYMQRGVDEWYSEFLSAIRRGRGAACPLTARLVVAGCSVGAMRER